MQVMMVTGDPAPLCPTAVGVRQGAPTARVAQHPKTKADARAKKEGVLTEDKWIRDD